ncbi:MAG TPA: M48 family metallopeptidase, partial [Thermoanaerobaculia bacterium]|nr:M48 family metallopeptidase [Thermoanaerobaculia bacterium]
MRALLKIGLAVAAVALTAAVVARVSAQAPPEAEKRDEKKFEVRITDEMIRHSRIRDTLYFVGVAWTFATLGIVLLTGLSRRMRDLAAKKVKKPWVVAAIYIILFTLVTALLDFPLTYYSGFVVPHQFDLTDQSFGAWMGEQLKGLGIGLVMSALLGATALLGIRKVKNWWFAIWLVSIPIIILFGVVQPIVLDPIFNKFEPLKDEVLRQKLLDLASKAGIEGSRVYQADASKQTKTMNAYVNGIGPTNRIVMWDTLLAKMNHDEVLVVMGHEMGHYVMKHVWKTMAFLLTLTFFILYLVQKIHDRTLPKWGPRWGFTERGDPASVPWLLILFSALNFLVTPVIAAYSRSNEHRSDKFALELTRLNEPMATAFVKLAEDSKRDPSPHPLIKYWRYTHPPIAERIPFALSYKPWEEGKPNEVWKGEGGEENEKLKIE